jgi:hypothetical protein
MIGWATRRLILLLGRRLGWIALATVVRTAMRRGATGRVDVATAELEERLPVPLRSALATLPRDPVRLGGRAAVAGRSARRAAAGAGRASRAANDGRRRLVDEVDRLADAVDRRPRPARAGRALGTRLGLEVRAERQLAERRFRSRMLRHLDGDAVADDALLDLRPPPGHGAGGGSGPAPDELPDPPTPVRSGRWRAPRGHLQAPVPRVQRSYRPPTHPWDV